jgi:hypothetical protein
VHRGGEIDSEVVAVAVSTVMGKSVTLGGLQKEEEHDARRSAESSGRSFKWRGTGGCGVEWQGGLSLRWRQW